MEIITQKRIFSKEHRLKLSEAHKGKTGYWKNKHFSLEHRVNMGLVRKGVKYENGRVAWNKGVSEGQGNRWKGDNVGYGGLHHWVKKHLGKSNKCSYCFSNENVEWANKSHKYKRDLTDWMQLCRSCHHVYDNIAYKRNRDLLGRFL